MSGSSSVSQGENNTGHLEGGLSVFVEKVNKRSRLIGIAALDLTGRQGGGEP